MKFRSFAESDHKLGTKWSLTHQPQGKSKLNQAIHKGRRIRRPDFPASNEPTWRLAQVFLLRIKLNQKTQGKNFYKNFFPRKKNKQSKQESCSPEEKLTFERDP